MTEQTDTRTVPVLHIEAETLECPKCGASLGEVFGGALYVGGLIVYNVDGLCGKCGRDIYWNSKIGINKVELRDLIRNRVDNNIKMR